MAAEIHSYFGLHIEARSQKDVLSGVGFTRTKGIEWKTGDVCSCPFFPILPMCKQEKSDTLIDSESSCKRLWWKANRL